MQCKIVASPPSVNNFIRHTQKRWSRSRVHLNLSLIQAHAEHFNIRTERPGNFHPSKLRVDQRGTARTLRHQPRFKEHAPLVVNSADRWSKRLHNRLLINKISPEHSQWLKRNMQPEGLHASYQTKTSTKRLRSKQHTNSSFSWHLIT